MITKKLLRERFKSFRNEFSSEQWIQISDLIQLQFIDWFNNTNFKSVGIYLDSAKHREVGTSKIIEYMQKNDVSVSVPIVISENGMMQFAKFNGVETMRFNKWGIQEPIHAQPVSKDHIDVLVVPMLGGDRNGGRVGYGKGYYDRYMADFKGIAVGLSPLKCILDEIPIDVHDKNMDFIITESLLIRRVDYQK